MNIEFFIASKILTGKGNHANISKSIISIAKFAVALSLAVMIIAVAVVIGFKSTIKQKVVGFGSHLQIVNHSNNSSYELPPLYAKDIPLAELKRAEGIRHVQQFAMKSGIIKTEDNVQGVVVKGIGADFDWSFFKSYLISGNTFSVSAGKPSNCVVISKNLADMLSLSIGSSFITSFVPSGGSENIRYRVFRVEGIYQTNFEEFDQRFILADISHVQKLNNWTSEQVAGYEITIDDFDEIDHAQERVMDLVGYKFQPDGSRLSVRSIVELNPGIFDWLNLLDTNVWVILVLMVVVASMNMISSLLVIILERTNMIGILKSLGSRNSSIRKIFLYNAAFIVGFGMLWGNILGVTICMLQHFYKLVPLDPGTYFISYVPVSINPTYLVMLNAGTLIITVLMLILPSLIITKISPARAIRFE